MTKKEINQLGYDIIACAIQVHNALGPGLLESVYEECLAHELISSGFHIKRQVVVPITYKEVNLKTKLRTDLLVNDCIVVELKTVEAVNSIYRAQVLSYMKLLKCPKGILINFFTEKITDSAIHLVNEYFEELP